MVEREPLIPKHGGYRKLKSFQVLRCHGAILQPLHRPAEPDA